MKFEIDPIQEIKVFIIALLVGTEIGVMFGYFLWTIWI